MLLVVWWLLGNKTCRQEIHLHRSKHKESHTWWNINQNNPNWERQQICRQQMQYKKKIYSFLLTYHYDLETDIIVKPIAYDEVSRTYEKYYWYIMCKTNCQYYSTHDIIPSVFELTICSITLALYSMSHNPNYRDINISYPILHLLQSNLIRLKTKTLWNIQK